MKIRFIAAIIFAGLIGGLLGNTVVPHQAKAASLGVLVWCTSVSSTGTGTNVEVTETCPAAPGDTSGLMNFSIQFTAPTQRYPLNTNATITLP